MNPAYASAPSEHVQAIWRERAVRLAFRPVAAASGQAVLVVVIAGEQYGIDLDAVVEVLPPSALTPIPGTPEPLAGILNVHGELRPVLDVERLWGAPAAPGRGPVCVVLLRRRGQVMGLQVDTASKIKPAAEDESSGSANVPVHYLKGLTLDGLRLLRTEALFAEVFKGVPECS